MKTDFNLPQSLIDAVTKVVTETTFKPTSPAEMVVGDTVKVHKPGYALHGKTCKIKGFSGSTAELEHANQTYHVHQKHLAVQESVNSDEVINEETESLEESTVTIDSPGHRFHGKSAKVFFKHPDGRVNVQLTHSTKKGDVTNLTLKPGQFKNLTEGAVPAVKQKIYIARNRHGDEVSRHTTKEAAEAQSRKYGGTSKLAEETEVLDEASVSRKHFQQVADVIKSHPDQAKRNELAAHHAGIFAKANPRFDHKRFYAASGATLSEENLEERTQVTRDKTGKLISWKAESEWRKRSKKEARGVVTHDSDKARRKTEQLTKEETEVLDEGNFPLEIHNKIKAYKNLGLHVQDTHLGTKDGKDYAHYTVVDKEGIGRKHIHHGDSKRLENLGQVRAVEDDTNEAGEKVAKRRGRPPKDKFAAK